MNEEQQDVNLPSVNFMDEKLFKSDPYLSLGRSTNALRAPSPNNCSRFPLKAMIRLPSTSALPVGMWKAAM